MSDPKRMTAERLKAIEHHVEEDSIFRATLIGDHNRELVAEIRAAWSEIAELRRELNDALDADRVTQLELENLSLKESLGRPPERVARFHTDKAFQGLKAERDQLQAENAELRAADKPACAHGIPTERKCAICEG